MRIVVNGETKDCDSASLTVAELLVSSNVLLPETVSVQLNGSFVPGGAFAGTEVKEGDSLDFLYFMGGGR